jgi:hypothetical protein
MPADRLNWVLEMTEDQRSSLAGKVSSHLKIFSRGALADHYENAYAQVLAGSLA